MSCDFKYGYFPIQTLHQHGVVMVQGDAYVPQVYIPLEKFYLTC